MLKLPSVTTGQRYRDKQVSLPRVGAQIWVVETVFTGTDGVEYAELACLGEPSLRKSLATAVLRDKHRFERQ